MTKKRAVLTYADWPRDEKGDPRINRCHCGAIGSFGYNVSWLANRKTGEWYCHEHRPDKPVEV